MNIHPILVSNNTRNLVSKAIKTALTLLITILLSCNQKETTLLDELYFDTIVACDYEILSIDSLLLNAAVDMHISDSLLIILDFIGQKHALVCIDLNNQRIVSKLAEKGKAPGEIINPSFNAFMPNKATIQLFDPNYCRLFEYAIIGDEIKQIELPYEMMKNENSWSAEVIKINNNFLSIGFGEQYNYSRFYCSSANDFKCFSGKISKVPNEIERSEFQELLMYVRRTAIKPDLSKIAFASYIGGRLEIYDISNIRDSVYSVCTKNFTPYTHYVNTNGSIAWGDKTFMGFEDIYSTDNYIYAIYNGCVGSDYETYPNKISVFNWQGEPILQYQLDKSIRAITVDEPNDIIYAVYYDENDTGLLKIKI
jgi:hypothetical protein